MTTGQLGSRSAGLGRRLGRFGTTGRQGQTREPRYGWAAPGAAAWWKERQTRAVSPG
jgi:hypothetical protein